MMNMEDTKIIELYEARDEGAIEATREKYGTYMNAIAYNITRSREDSEECVQDAYVKTWGAIPPAKPDSLKAFVGRITRNTALDRYSRNTAEKRGGSETDLIYEELAECLSEKAGSLPEDAVELKELTAIINEVLSTLSRDSRNIFVLRYWYMYSDAEVAEKLGFKEGKVRTSLSRTRAVIRETLIREGY